MILQRETGQAVPSVNACSTGSRHLMQAAASRQRLLLPQGAGYSGQHGKPPRVLDPRPRPLARGAHLLIY